MNILLMSSLLLLFGLFALGGLILIIDFLTNLRPGRIVYVGSNMARNGGDLTGIIRKFIKKPEEYVFVELGSGLGFVITFLNQAFSWKRLVAVELSWHYLMLAKVRAKLMRLPSNIVWERANIFSFTCRDRRVIYCYLSSQILERLYKEDRLKNALVISLTFQIPGLVGEKFPISGWQEAYYVYDFR